MSRWSMTPRRLLGTCCAHETIVDQRQLSGRTHMTTSVSKAVLITGCSTGIGRATAERLARGGHTVYATARRPESIADLAQHGCRLLALDVCDEASMQAAVREVEREHGAVGVLINNAGYGSEGPAEEVPMS